MLSNVKNSIHSFTYRYLAFSALFTFTLFSQVIFFDFQLGWDDQWVVINDYTESGLSLENVANIFKDFYHGQYAPINQLYYSFVYLVDGYNPTVFHLVGLIIHCINCGLVFIFLSKLIRQGHFCGPLYTFSRQNWIAFFASIIFSIHPVNVEAIAWIAASKIILYALLYLIALIFYLNYIKYKKAIWYFLSASFFIASFGAKEQAVTFPLAIILIDIVLTRKVSFKKSVIEKLPLILLSVFFGILTIRSQQTLNTISDPNTSFNFFQRGILAIYSSIEYLSKSLIPIKLSYMYPFPFQPFSSVPFWLLLYSATFIFVIYLLKNIFKIKVIKFGLFFFTIHILVALHMIHMSRFAVTADRYMYISLVGMVLLISFLADYLLKSFVRNKLYLIFLFSLYLFFLSFQSYTYLQKWQNTATLKNEFIKQIKQRTNHHEKEN